MPSINSRSVLVVDDDHDLLHLVAAVLEAEGYRVQVAADGSQALGVLQHSTPDLILLDMRMPVMDGWRFAREYHAKYGKMSPIVVITASADARKFATAIGAAG